MVYKMASCKGCAQRREYLRAKAEKVKQSVTKMVATVKGAKNGAKK